MLSNLMVFKIFDEPIKNKNIIIITKEIEKFTLINFFMNSKLKSLHRNKKIIIFYI